MNNNTKLKSVIQTSQTSNYTCSLLETTCSSESNVSWQSRSGWLTSVLEAHRRHGRRWVRGAFLALFFTMVLWFTMGTSTSWTASEYFQVYGLFCNFGPSAAARNCSYITTCWPETQLVCSSRQNILNTEAFLPLLLTSSRLQDNNWVGPDYRAPSYSFPPVGPWGKGHWRNMAPSVGKKTKMQSGWSGGVAERRVGGGGTPLSRLCV